MMRLPVSPVFVLAPDSFKGSLSAQEVCVAMAQAIHSVLPAAQVISKPMADGGEGTVETLVNATEGHLHHLSVTGPMGIPVNASYGVSGDGRTAFIEMASASGYAYSAHDSQSVRRATTFGTGELLLDAVDRGIREVIMGIGGSATNDGGAGFLQALGARLLDSKGEELSPGGASLLDLVTIDVSDLDPRLSTIAIRIASDVDNPLTGDRGASAVYGPQKGATSEDVKLLDDALAHFAQVVERVTRRSCKEIAGAGAAGGLGFALLSFTQATLQSGASLVAEAIGLQAAIEQADYVFTGEGRMDRQTLAGKTPAVVATLAQSYDKPVIAFAGSLEAGMTNLPHPLFDTLIPITPADMPLSQALSLASFNLQLAVSNYLRSLPSL